MVVPVSKSGMVLDFLLMFAIVLRGIGATEGSASTVTRMRTGLTVDLDAAGTGVLMRKLCAETCALSRVVFGFDGEEGGNSRSCERDSSSIESSICLSACFFCLVQSEVCW